MAISITIMDSPEECQHFFEDNDPMYWFLFPYFEELYQQTAQMVDLYGRAEFRAEDLRAFDLILENVERVIDSHDDHWQVKVSHGKYRQLIKSEALSCVATLKRLIHQAQQCGSCVICLGD